MKQTGIYITLLSAFCSSTLAADLQPLMTESGKSLLSEDFAGDAIPQLFRTLQTPDSFRIVAGVLEATAKAGQGRATHGAFMVGGHNFTVAFSVKFNKPGTLYIGVDGYSPLHQGNTHLVRFSLSPERMAWDQKLGSAESKHAAGEAMKAARAAKQKLPPPTPEQLADPNFFRTEDLAARDIECPIDQWHDVLLEVNGNELVAQVDGQKLIATATVADAKKNRIGLGLTGRSTVLIDNFRMYENSRRSDWQQVKSNLAGNKEAKK